MFRYVELKLPALPSVSVDRGIYTVAFPLPGTDGSFEPVMTVEGLAGDAVSLSCVLSRAILSVKASEPERSVALLPDGRLLSRSGDTQFQEGPERRGAKIIHGETSITIGADGRVIVVGGDFALVIERDGTVSRQNDPAVTPIRDDPATPLDSADAELPVRGADSDPDAKA